MAVISNVNTYLIGIACWLMLSVVGRTSLVDIAFSRRTSCLCLVLPFG